MRKPCTPSRLAFAAWALLTSSVAFAAGVSSERILTVGQAGWRDQPHELAGFADGELVFDILIPKSLDSSTLQIEQVQISGRVAVSLGAPQSLTEFYTVNSPDGFGLTELRVKLPKLQRKTLLALVVTTTTAERVVKVAVVRVVVYPHFDWEPVARKLKNDDTRLMVFGKSQPLRDFLLSKNVTFSAQSDAVPASLEGNAIYLGSGSTGVREARNLFSVQGAAHIVFFVENTDADAGVPDASPPGVYVNSRGKITVTEVTLPVLDRLVTDPRSEELLFNLIEQQLRPMPVAAP